MQSNMQAVLACPLGVFIQDKLMTWLESIFAELFEILAMADKGSPHLFKVNSKNGGVLSRLVSSSKVMF